MPAGDLGLLEELGFTQYERKTLRTLMLHGVADAETLCREGDIPSSKICLALEKLAKLRLVEIQPTRPKLFSSPSTDAVFRRLTEISQARADRFASEAERPKERFASLPSRTAGRTTFVDLALGRDSHVARHLVHLAAAQNRIWSYMEQGDIAAIEGAKGSGAPLLHRIARNAAARSVDHHVVFGFGTRTAPKLLAFLKRRRTNLDHASPA